MKYFSLWSNHPEAHNNQQPPSADMTSITAFCFSLLAISRAEGSVLWVCLGLVIGCHHRDRGWFIGNLKQSTRSFGAVWFGAGESGIGHYLTGPAIKELWDAATRPQVHCCTHRKLSKRDIIEMESYLTRWGCITKLFLTIIATGESSSASDALPRLYPKDGSHSRGEGHLWSFLFTCNISRF